MKRIPLAIPHMSGKEMVYIEQAFAENWIAPVGPNVDLFEEKVCRYTGAEFATATSSGTAAIHLALRMLEVGHGDTVFCPSFTFAASANPIHYQGAKAVFIDSELETWNMSPIALERALLDAQQHGQLPKAIIVVHIYGQPAKMTEIMALAKSYGVPVIEDAAESLGSLHHGVQTGTIGDIGIYSFNGNKIITTSGGGMLVSAKEDWTKEAKFLSEQAKEPAPYYQHEKIGYNYRLSNISAGIGCGQMEVLQERIDQKRLIFERYAEGFAKYSETFSNFPRITYQQESEGTFSNRWLSTIQIQGIHPLQLKEALDANGIEGRLLWKPLHLQPVFQKNRFFAEDVRAKISNAQRLFESGFCLPSATQMTLSEQHYVIQTVAKFLIQAGESV
ncbi:aminotransferase class I/II-fold pyridoxal phosphate-dependent enzyme [Listeria weihenstephanensis]|uniref:Aminotransferase class I/II-fold pyridoxal phosphate-dependent enzyme n=1 Tax=Listeria weihenstephanensis TaxID=1006155 RepID=A0A841ZAK8_9LIST|nr:aminotransferase class I/II-fold pyridoxal phosphate-dependent enzyme [Listeria weihenstephanensis]MBC1501642.1 aminotransferase class I/II-fold pyridoxal phosphate-dependent enzyme [Listeria weihenstephanensis]